MLLVGKGDINMEKTIIETEISRMATMGFKLFGGLIFIFGTISYLMSHKTWLESSIYIPLLIYLIYAWFSGHAIRIDDPIKYWLRKAIHLRVLVFYSCVMIYIIDDGFDVLYLSFSIVVVILSVICFFIGMKLHDEKLMNKMIKENINFINGKLDPEQTPPGNIFLYSFRSPKSRLIRGVTGSAFKFVILFIVFPLSLLGGGAGYFTLEIFKFFLGDSAISPHAIETFIVCLPASMYLAFQLPALIHFKRKWETMYPMK